MHTLHARINIGLLVFIALTGIALVAMLATRASGGPLDPPGSPASTLSQVEPRNPIPPVGWNGTSPITIASPGSYFLTQNLFSIPITIGSDNVTFDLNGFTLAGTPNLNGVTATAGTKRNIVVRNGALAGWSVGISLENATRSTLSDLQISGAVTGLAIGSGNVVSRIRSHNNSTGIYVGNAGDLGGSIEQSNLSGNTNYGILIVGSHVAIRNSVIDANTLAGIQIQGSWNDVAENHIVGNGVGLAVFGNRNVIAENHIDGNVNGPVFVNDDDAGNIVGPISPGTSMNPAENIGFP